MEKSPSDSQAPTIALAGERRAVVAKVPQGYDTRIKIRVLPAGDLRLQPKGCQPRQGARRRDAAAETLPPSLSDRLKDVNVQLLGWLAKAPENAKLFLTEPVAALARAGVKLDRAEQKALARLHEAAAAARVVGPGVYVTGIAVSADPRGRVSVDRPGGGGDRPPAGGSPPKTDRGDCGCGG